MCLYVDGGVFLSAFSFIASEVTASREGLQYPMRTVLA